MTRKILFLLLFLNFHIGFSQQNQLSENTQVSIISVGLADQVYELYGHTALRIKDSKSSIDMVYNYGMFDFATENFMLKFAKGNLQYFAAAYPYSDFEYSYKLDNRSIYEQVLDISLQEKQNLFDKLNASLQSKDKYYTYKFIDRNCTTKVIDIVNSVLKNKPIKKLNINNATYREVLNPYVENHFFYKLGINIIFGEKVDHQASTIFLPLDLMENLKKTSYQNKALISETKTVFEAKRPFTIYFWDSIYFLIGVLLLFVIINKKATNIIYFSVLGTIGLVFILMSLYSFHKELYWNYNVLMLNPLLLVLVYFVFTNNKKWIKRITSICIILLGIYTFYMFGKVHLWIVLPIIIANFVILIRLYLKNKIT
jgi:Domain of unknown function (DUF4105)